MAKVVCFGEVMLRLQPYHYERFVQAENVQFTFGGAEANVAVSLANFGVDVSYVTKLPAHMIGQAAINTEWIPERLSAGETESAFTLMKRVPLSAPVFAPTIERIPRFPKQRKRILTGKISLAVRSGSILPASPRPYPKMFWRFGGKPAKSQRKRELRFPAMLTTAVSFGRRRRQEKP